jgi:hypothetical protein
MYFMSDWTESIFVKQPFNHFYNDCLMETENPLFLLFQLVYSLPAIVHGTRYYPFLSLTRVNC